MKTHIESIFEAIIKKVNAPNYSIGYSDDDEDSGVILFYAQNFEPMFALDFYMDGFDDSSLELNIQFYENTPNRHYSDSECLLERELQIEYDELPAKEIMQMLKDIEQIVTNNQEYVPL